MLWRHGNTPHSQVDGIILFAAIKPAAPNTSAEIHTTATAATVVETARLPASPLALATRRGLESATQTRLYPAPCSMLHAPIRPESQLIFIPHNGVNGGSLSPSPNPSAHASAAHNIRQLTDRFLEFTLRSRYQRAVYGPILLRSIRWPPPQVAGSWANLKKRGQNAAIPPHNAKSPHRLCGLRA